MILPFELGICVADLDRMVAFYVDVLGCREVGRATLPARATRAIGLATGDVTIVWLQTAWGERLKLLRPAEDPEPLDAARTLTARCGVAYLTFCVDDLAARTARAEAWGAEPVVDRYVTDDGRGQRISFFRDPEGTAVELVERDDPAAYRPDVIAPA
jgi:catechol 2,3-dioxygenase-like lactoylglutathione lyase family enzyme